MSPTLSPGPTDSLADIAGLRVGHHHLLDDTVTVAAPGVPGSGAATGCTVVLADRAAVGAVDVRGGGPGTRETDLLDPSHSVQRVDAVLLTGGSAYGLAAADGVMRWLEEHGRGIVMGLDGETPLVVPIVPGAVIFDLPVGDWSTRPTADSGYAATAAAHAATSVPRGCVGAGVGARAGSLKGGVGTASVRIGDGAAAGATVAALVVANPVGSVVDPETGLPWGLGPGRAAALGLTAPTAADLETGRLLGAKGTVLNTTIGVVATDATLSTAACRRVAVAGHDGLARAIRPAHSPLDGDTLFALSTGTADLPAPGLLPDAFASELPVLAAVCEAAAEVVQRAIVDALLSATGLAGIPSYRDVYGTAFDAR
ncbi:P1 family peptidase [Rhodococcus sp. HM1]|uniref:P1 family peptidase n=1 Tax=unclassified Rhodococcus (in: high G+C Gram-positive bacteria) TaxID=192944 RepID=UPI0018CEBBD3|nr:MULTISPECIES: P1 family peptidase [unclassified Rhodococcus (in: high G+C Gram-positive bacteria)]MBH0122810.1 P1 family peptidase [Rhodococcus sp. CX]MCK8671426.1 P1 family peptidase [Rhodococcus sp. HM1]